MSAGGPAAVWSGAEYELLAERFEWIYDELVERLRPGPGLRWLDVATGSGEVALRAARAGADVAGIDIAPGMIEKARAKADGVPLRLDLGDAQELPYEDAAFDVVSSTFGVIFAPKPDRAAAELARVCRSEGRLGITTWRPVPAVEEIYARYSPGNPPPVDEWGSEEQLRRLLGRDFELTVEERVWHLEADSPEAMFEFMSRAAPPVKALLGVIDDDARGALRRDLVAYWQQFETDHGVREPRRFLLALGRRR